MGRACLALCARIYVADLYILACIAFALGVACSDLSFSKFRGVDCLYPDIPV